MRLKKNNFIARIFSRKKPKSKIYDAREYGLSRDGFDYRAREVVKTLQDNGYEAYVVGGGVRDQLLDLHPKDFDVVTNAWPEQVKKCFRHCIIIGRRFRLAHVIFGRQSFIEVATFRKIQSSMMDKVCSTFKKSGIVARDNEFGSLEEDAFRRDFTINALYYDPVHHHIIDFNRGMDDIKHKILRLIGKPSVRLQEDPVRILRAIRISNKTGFIIDPAMDKAMPAYIPLLSEIAGGRLFDEYQKIFLHGNAKQNFTSLKKFLILPYLFPKLDIALQDEQATRMVECALRNTDARYQEGKTINPAFLISVFLWKAVRQRQLELRKNKRSAEAFQQAMQEILKEQTRATNMPGYLPAFIEQVWSLQWPLERCHKAKILNILSHPRYRAAYDFLLLRAEIGEVKQPLCQRWQVLYEMTEEERLRAVEV